MISATSSKTVVKSVAIFEAIKGAGVLLGGFGFNSPHIHNLFIDN